MRAGGERRASLAVCTAHLDGDCPAVTHCRYTLHRYTLPLHIAVTHCRYASAHLDGDCPAVGELTLVYLAKRQERVITGGQSRKDSEGGSVREGK